MKIQISLITILSLIIGTYTTTVAQEISIDKLSFKTPFEEYVFKNHNTLSSLELLLAISPNMDEAKALDIKKQIHEFEEKLKNKKFELKKESKKVKTLFDETHYLFLEKYHDVANFDEIFANKTFNCVSGSALYALILDDFNIPYAIKESPTHVYLVVNPNSSHIVLESTRPDIGFIDKSDHYIKSVMDQLIDLKQLTKDEVKTKGYRTAYNDYFFSEDTIPTKALASIQYSNEAITLMEEEKHEEALNSAYKAQYLNESPSNAYIITMILNNNMIDNELNDSIDFSRVVEYSNFTNNNADYIEALHTQKINSKIFQEGDLEFAENITNYFINNLKDSNLITSIEVNYLMLLADYYQAKADWDNSITYASKAYTLNPSNVRLQGLIGISINNKNVGKAFSQDILDELLGYKATYPFLADHSMVNNMISSSSIYLALKYLSDRKISKSVETMAIFEDLINTQQDKISFNEEFVAQYYKQLCEYYFQVNKYSKGSQAIKRGLTIIPNNELLNSRKSVLKRAGYYKD